MFLQRFQNSRCCLCGSSENLTGEHKIKASALRKEFGKESLVIGSTEGGMLKPAQGVNSKRFKFDIPICEVCNTSRSQAADREFDCFHQLAVSKIECGQDLSSLFDMERYSKDSASYLNIFRYFAKLLCCHIAAVNGPVPTMLAKFAIAQSPFNRIWLEVKADPVYEQVMSQIGVHQYAAHGGLVIYGDKKSGEPNAFHSTLTVGPVQYVFHTRLESIELMEMRRKYPDFLVWCASKVLDATENPISENMRLRLGLRDADP